MFDANLMFFSSGDLTQSKSSSALTVYGIPLKGAGVRIEVPEANGADATILAKLYESDDGSTYNVLSSLEGGAASAYGGKSLYLGIPQLKGKKYLKLELIITDTTPDFGAVKAGIVLGKGASIDRSVNW